MIQILPFVAGLVVGAAAISALRSERARQTMDSAGARLRSAAHVAEDGVRAAAQSGLALWRGATVPATVAETPAAPPAEPAAAPAKPRRSARKPAAQAAAKPKAAAPRQARTPKAATPLATEA